jgi:hypothetical protein
MPKGTELFFCTKYTVSLLDYIKFAEFLIFRNGFFCKPKEGIRHYFVPRELVNVN